MDQGTRSKEWIFGFSRVAADSAVACRLRTGQKRTEKSRMIPEAVVDTIFLSQSLS